MKSSWTLLVVAFYVSICGLLLLVQTVASEKQQNADGGVGAEDDDELTELEDKMIRTWIEHFVERYNRGVQQASSSSKSAHIQRIAKKSRTSTSTAAAVPVSSHRHAAPLPVLPVLFNPYYPTGYHNFVPFPHGPTAHLIPISQQEYYQRFLAPYTVHFPYAYTHVPAAVPVSSTPIIIDNHNPSKIKKPANVQILYPPPPYDQDDTRKLPGEITAAPHEADVLNENPSDNGQTSQVEEHRPPDDKIEEDGENEGANVPPRDGKLLDDDQPTTTTTTTRPPDQTAEPQRPVQHSQQPQRLDASTPRDTTVSDPTETQNTTPVTPSEIPNVFESLFPSKDSNSISYYRSPPDRPTGTTRQPEAAEESETAPESPTTVAAEHGSSAEWRDQQPRDAETQPPSQTVNETTTAAVAAPQEQSVPGDKSSYVHAPRESPGPQNQTQGVSSTVTAAKETTTSSPAALVTGSTTTTTTKACANDCDCGRANCSDHSSSSGAVETTTVVVLANSSPFAVKTTVGSTSRPTSTAIDEHKMRLNSVVGASSTTTQQQLTSPTILETTTPSLPTTTVPRKVTAVPVASTSADTPRGRNAETVVSVDRFSQTPRDDNGPASTTVRLTSTTVLKTTTPPPTTTAAQEVPFVPVASTTSADTPRERNAETMVSSVDRVPQTPRDDNGSVSTTARLTSTTVLETTTTTATREVSIVPVVLMTSADTPRERNAETVISVDRVPQTPTLRPRPDDNGTTRLSSTTPPGPQRSRDDNSTTTTTQRPEAAKIERTAVSSTPAVENAVYYAVTTKRSANVDDKSTTTTTTSSSVPKERNARTTEQDDCLPSAANAVSGSRLSPVEMTTAVKSNAPKDVEVDRFATAKETTVRSATKPTIVQVVQTKPRNPVQKPQPAVIADGSKNRKSAQNQSGWYTTTEPSRTTKDSDLWYSHVNAQSSRKKELNEREIDFLLKKLIKLLKPEIEKESTADESSITRFLAPKLGDREKLIYVIFPFIKEEAKNMINEERTENGNEGSVGKNSDKM